jgi:hypothetical protein
LAAGGLWQGHVYGVAEGSRSRRVWGGCCVMYSCTLRTRHS